MTKSKLLGKRGKKVLWITILATTCAVGLARWVTNSDGDDLAFLYGRKPHLERRFEDNEHPGDPRYGMSTVLTFSRAVVFRSNQPKVADLPSMEELVRSRFGDSVHYPDQPHGFGAPYVLTIEPRSSPTPYKMVVQRLKDYEIWIPESRSDYWLRQARIWLRGKS